MIDRGWLHDRIQRTFDMTVAALMLLVTAPLMLFVAALVAWRLGRPVFFRQQRPGLHGRPFTMVKFRTMRDEDPRQGLVTDADRMTRLGQLLRSTSVDELPTLWNILKGDMSLVGPRPLLMHYLDLYTPEQSRRHLVRPGLTGLAQVRGRNALTWEARFDMDVWYVEHRTLRLNIRILGETFLTVVRREGITAEGEVTMPQFTGTSTQVIRARNGQTRSDWVTNA
jgi:lipopolysaccharide/colanic/teichoic acid biosynthesis glycosyltransferase